MIFVDCETCGFVGMGVLIQYAVDDGPIILFNPWTNPIRDTLDLIEMIMNHEGGMVGFNIAFDHFHLCKLYTVFSLYHDDTEYPENIIDELGELEMQGRDGPCLKPCKSFDLMLHARKTVYQSTMSRGDIVIKRVPTQLAWLLASELEKRVKLKDLYFAKKANKKEPQWNVYDLTNSEGEMDPHFKNVVLKFKPSSALKALAADALNIAADEVMLFEQVEVDKAWRPVEFKYAPFAKAAGGNRHDWKGAWPSVIKYHIAHWEYHERARKYAMKDVQISRDLYKFFGSPEIDDDDSSLAAMVGAVRWRGFKIDIPKIIALRDKAIVTKQSTPTAPNIVKRWLNDALDETERIGLGSSTDRTALEALAKLTKPCPNCNSGASSEITISELNPDLVTDLDMVTSSIEKTTYTGCTTDPNCTECEGKGYVLHLAAKRALEVLKARGAIKQIELYEKLLLAGRFHADFKVLGALSGRMSGNSDLNAQGINKTKEVRECFPLAKEGEVLCGGDFAGYEISLACAAYNDPVLIRDLMTCEPCRGLLVYNREKNDFICESCGSNKAIKFHSLFGMLVYPGMSYEAIKATAGTENDLYTRSKSAVFALLYGGMGYTLQSRLSVDIDVANAAYERFMEKYRKVALCRAKTTSMFCTMQQVNGIGSRIEYSEPADSMSSLFGFKRMFTLENQICKALFDLAEKPPKSWADVKVKVVRRDREQLVSGAARSAIFAAAFALQASNCRAAVNHEIQSSGAQCTKFVQRRIWDLQPEGISPWKVCGLQIHDELQTVCDPLIVDKVEETVQTAVDELRVKIPLIKLDWVKNMSTWADKS